MKLRTTLALLLAAVALGIFIWILDRRSPGTRYQLARGDYIADIDRNDVTQLEIENGDARIKLVRTPDGWKLTAPINDRADQQVIDQLLSAVQFLKRRSVIADLGKGDQKRNYLKQFGVLRSHLILQCLGKHTRVEFQLGFDAAVEGACYLRVDGQEPVFITGNDLKNLISRNADYFRDHQLTPFRPSDVDSVLLSQPAGEIELSRVNDEWQILRPIKARADNGEINQFLQQVAATKILQFQKQEGSGDLDFENAPASLTLSSEDAKVKITCGPAVPNQPGCIYVRASDRLTFVVDDSLLRTIGQKPNDLRDRKIMRLNPDLIDRITIMSAGQPSLQLRRNGTDWVLADYKAGGIQTPAKADAVNRLIQTLNQSNVSRFVADNAIDLARYGLDKPALEFVFSSFSSQNTAEENAGEIRLASLAIGAADNDDDYARVEEEPYIVALPKQLVQQLPATSLDFRSASWQPTQPKPAPTR